MVVVRTARLGGPIRFYAVLGITLSFLSCAWNSPAWAIDPERVTFPSLEIDAATGKPVALSALYFSPDPSSGGYPAVIALHGCGGMYSAAPGRGDRLSPRHQQMADLLLAQGYAVLFPDSFNPRGRREVCSDPLGTSNITQDNRRLDVLGALTYLRTRADVDGDRIALLGWSHGGSAVLASVNRRHPAVASYLASPEAGSFFRTAIAFYPGCFASLRGREGYAPATRVDIFIGESDDWTSPKPCVALGRSMEAMGMPVHVKTYAGTYHGFDTPNMLRPQHLDVPNGVRPGQGVTVAPNREARDDAYGQVMARLRAAMFP
jgi:dienelactone hydrolase